MQSSGSMRGNIAANGPDHSVSACKCAVAARLVVRLIVRHLQHADQHCCVCVLQVPALLAVGLEGCWGLFLCSFLLPVTTLIRGPDGLPLDDAPAAFRAIWNNIELGGAVYLSIFSIAFFNFFGVSGEKDGRLG